MEQFELGHIEKLPRWTRDRVHNRIKALQPEFGDTFSMEETPDEYIIVQGKRKTHILKRSKISHMPDDPYAEIDLHDGWILADVIEAQIRFLELETSGEQMKALEVRQHILNENKNSPD